MDTELLKTFLEVSRTRHFGRAAEALYLTQSAVSFRIRQLENQLNVNLFTRHRHNIRLTPAGERLLPYAESLMNTWLIAKQEVSLASAHSPLSIGATALLWECVLTSWLADAYQQFHGAQYDIRIAAREYLVKQLHERHLDLLLTTEAPKMDELESQKLAAFDLALYAADKDRTLDELSYLRLEWGADFHQHEPHFIGNDDIPILTTSSAKLTCNMMPIVHGYTFLPVAWATSEGNLYQLSDSVIVSRPLYAIWLENSDKKDLIKSLLNMTFSLS